MEGDKCFSCGGMMVLDAYTYTFPPKRNMTATITDAIATEIGQVVVPKPGRNVVEVCDLVAKMIVIYIVNRLTERQIKEINCLAKANTSH